MTISNQTTEKDFERAILDAANLTMQVSDVMQRHDDAYVKSVFESVWFDCYRLARRRTREANSRKDGE